MVASADLHATLTVADCGLPAEARSEQVASDCARLEPLTLRYARPIRADLPDPRVLDRILADLGVAEQPQSLLQLFTAWLGERIREFWALLPDLPNPLGDVDIRIPGWLPEALRWTGAVLLAILVGAAGFLLLRAAGVPSPGALWRVLGRLGPEAQDDPPAGALDLADLEDAPRVRQPRILLALIVAALRRAQRLGADRTLSHRQIGPAVRDVTPGERANIEFIARLAERVTYSHFVPGDGDLAQAVQVTKTILGGRPG